MTQLKPRLLKLLLVARQVIADKQLYMSIMSATLVTILSMFSIFDRVESYTYSLASSIDLPTLGKAAALNDRPETIPRVLLISSEMYEKDFRQVSPLERRKLSEVFAAVLDARPSLLAVDLDLSPLLARSDEEARAQAQLDELLLAAARTTPVVLATPLPVEDLELRQQKFAWMQKLCQGGVHFGLPTLHASDGMVLRYSAELPTFAQVAARLLQPAQTKPQDGGHDETGRARPPAACTKIAGGGIEQADFLDPGFFLNAIGDGQSIKGMKLINANYFDPALEHNITAFSSVIEIPDAGDLAGRVVFLGGQYGIDDRFETLNGERYGAVVHAAIFYSLTHPLREIPKSVCKLVDVLLGILLAALFQAMWGRYYRDLLRYQGLKTAETHEQRILRAHAFGGAVIALWAVLAASGAVLWGLLLVSTVALKNGSQFSIAFMAFAMLLYCAEWNRKSAAQQEVRLNLNRLRDRFADPVHSAYSPVEVLDKFLAGDSRREQTSEVRGFMAETGEYVTAFLLRRRDDLRFIFFALPRTPVAAFWALLEFLTSLLPIAAVTWIVVESFIT